MLVTTCPDCETTFKVTVAILEKAGGQVRCGRCARIFDANARLREQAEARTERLPDATPGQHEARAGEAVGSRWYLRDDPSESGVTKAAVELTAADIAAPEIAALEDVAVDVVATEPDGTTTASSPGLEPNGGEAAATAGTAAGEPVALAAPTAAAATRAAESTAKLAETALDAPPPPSTSPSTSPLSVSQAPSETDWREDFAPTVRRRTWPWAVAAGVLTVTLTAQVIHAARNDLAGVPGVGPWLISAYATLGRELAAPVELEQYSTIDLTAAAEPVTDDLGWLIIETRVQNRGPNVQPFPHILIRLLDRWQETIAGRYFSPEEYLVSERGDYSRMDVGTTADAQFIIVDPGANATGFELEFCTPVGDGYRCDTQ